MMRKHVHPVSPGMHGAWPLASKQVKPMQHGVVSPHIWPPSAHTGGASGGGTAASGGGWTGPSGDPGLASGVGWTPASGGGGGGGGAGFLQMPVGSPVGMSHSRPVQQSPVAVQTPPSGMHVRFEQTRP